MACRFRLVRGSNEDGEGFHLERLERRSSRAGKYSFFRVKRMLGMWLDGGPKVVCEGGAGEGAHVLDVVSVDGVVSVGED